MGATGRANVLELRPNCEYCNRDLLRLRERHFLAQDVRRTNWRVSGVERAGFTNQPDVNERLN
jgi:hypothetical protein